MTSMNDKIIQEGVNATRGTFLEMLKTNRTVYERLGQSRDDALETNFVTVVGTLSITMCAMLIEKFGRNFDIDDEAEVQRYYISLCNDIANSLATDMRKFHEYWESSESPEKIVGDILAGFKKSEDKS